MRIPGKDSSYETSEGGEQYIPRLERILLNIHHNTVIPCPKYTLHPIFSSNQAFYAGGKVTDKAAHRGAKPFQLMKSKRARGAWCCVTLLPAKARTMAAAVHPYPTLGEINKKIAGTYLSSKIFSERIKKGLHFFFHLRGRACGPEEV